jgi:hypothetical protein
MPGAAAVDAAKVLAARDRILAAPEFNVTPDWRSRLGDWLLERLTGMGDFLPTALRWMSLAILAAGLVAVLLWLLPRRQRGARARPAGAVSSRRRSFAALEGDAAAALARGELAESVRLAWLAALSLIDEAGVSAARAARADWEHVETARRHRAALAEPLAALATEFQRTRFGAAPLSAADAGRCLALLGTLERALGG